MIETTCEARCDMCRRTERRSGLSWGDSQLPRSWRRLALCAEGIALRGSWDICCQCQRAIGKFIRTQADEAYRAEMENGDD